MHDFLSRVFLILFFSSVSVADSTVEPVAAPNIAIDVKHEDGISSAYTNTILKLIKEWPAGKEKRAGADEDLSKVALKTECFETKGESYYIGHHQQMLVNAPFERVEAVLDGVDEYQSFFPDFKIIRKEDTQQNKMLVYWEQGSPVFFMENIKYKIIYVTSKPTADLKIYRQQLKEGNYLKASDAVIFIERAGENKTRFHEYGFWDARWGLAKTFGLESKIWLENIKGNTRAELGIKLKSENPDWTGKKVQDEAKKLLATLPWESAIKNRALWQDEKLIGAAPKDPPQNTEPSTSN